METQQSAKEHQTESQTQIKAKGCRIIASQKSGDAKSEKKIEIDIERAKNNAEEISKEQEEFETVVQFKTEVGCTSPAEKSIVIKTNKEGWVEDGQVPTGWSEVLQENAIIPDGWKAEDNIKQSAKV